LFQTILRKILELSRINKASLAIFFDSISIIIVLLASFSLRVGEFYVPAPNLTLLIFGCPVVAIPIFIRFGLYRSIIRFIGFRDLWKIIKASTLYALIWSIIALMFEIQGVRSVVVINWLIVMIYINGSRMFVRWLLTDLIHNKYINVVIYGAGSAGRQLMYALKQSDEYNPVGFVDDSIEIHNTTIDGIDVIAPKNLANLISKKRIKEILLAMPSLSRVKRTEIINFLETYPLIVKSLPSVSEITDGKVTIEDLQEIKIEDLLGRDQVQPSKQLLKTNILDKVVMVTGAGGSIGSELCRQIIVLRPKKLILLDISESSLYQIDQELSDMDIDDVLIYPILASIRDNKRLKKIFRLYKVQTIYHAAAYKHVPLVEYNSSEGVLNNAIGTMIIAETAIAEKIETFVLISTDKAVRPTNTMGASKRVAELVLLALSKENHNTCLTMVRFGNVLDSSGSVIPLFRKQIKNGGPITVTDVNIVRYFMTVHESVELVIQAGAMSTGGDVFILDMGEPILINDLAVKMIKLSGLNLIDENHPDGDIEIIYTGLRPGEKLYEELLVGLSTSETENKLIMRAEDESRDWQVLKPFLESITDAAMNSDQQRTRNLLIELIPEFIPKDDIVDLLHI
jgi:FlaA1/EpsC-like NDP-sugar epimerase